MPIGDRRLLVLLKAFLIFIIVVNRVPTTLKIGRWKIREQDIHISHGTWVGGPS
jgi:hypothetical protein